MWSVYPELIVITYILSFAQAGVGESSTTILPEI